MGQEVISEMTETTNHFLPQLLDLRAGKRPYAREVRAPGRHGCVVAEVEDVNGLVLGSPFSPIASATPASPPSPNPPTAPRPRCRNRGALETMGQIVMDPPCAVFEILSLEDYVAASDGEAGGLRRDGSAQHLRHRSAQQQEISI
jgi:hypothetical protein